MLKASETRFIGFTREGPEKVSPDEHLTIPADGWRLSEIEDLCRASRIAGGVDDSIITFPTYGNQGRYSATLTLETDLLGFDA